MTCEASSFRSRLRLPNPKWLVERLRGIEVAVTAVPLGEVLSKSISSNQSSSSIFVTISLTHCASGCAHAAYAAQSEYASI